MSQTANRVIKNTGYLYMKMAITMFVSLYTTRLILNSLGVSDFGIFNIVGGAIAMLGFLNSAMASATQRFMSFSEGSGDKEKQKSIFNISLVIHFLTAILVAIALIVAGFFFFNGILNIPANRVGAAEVVYGSLIISTAFTVMTVPYDAVMNAHENMRYYAIVGIFESLLKLSVAFACVYTSADKLIVYGILMACIPLVTLTIMRVYCHRHYIECVIAPFRFFDKSLAKEMTSFAGWNLTSSAVTMVSSYGQGLIVNNFFGTIVNAAQGIASQLNGQLIVFSGNMLKALNPVLGKSAGAGDIVLLAKSAIKGAKYSAAIYLLFAIPFFFEAPYILRLWLKNVPEWTVVFVRFQLVKSFIELQFTTVPSTISASGKIKKYTLFSSLSNLMQLPTIYVLFKCGLPPYYMYIATIIFGNIIVYIIALHFAKLYCGMPISLYIRKTLLPLYVTLSIICCLHYVYLQVFSVSNILSLLIYALFAFVSFLLTFGIVGCPKEDRRVFAVALKKLPVLRKRYS